MNHRLAIALIVCLSAMSLGGIPTATALFADTDSTPGGSIHAGVLDLKLSEVGPASRASTTDQTQQDTVQDTIEDLNHGSATVSNTLRIDNTQSSLPAQQVGLTVTYTDSDRKSKGTKGNADATAQTLRLSQVSYKKNSLLGSTIRDENANGRYDVHDLTLGQTKTNLAGLSGLSASGTADFRLSITGDRTLRENKVKSGDGVDITFRIEGSARSFIDADSSTSNTIRYA